MVFPGVGTAAGGLVGGVAGGIAGTKVGQWVGQRFGAGWNWAFGDDDERSESRKKPKSTGGGILGTGGGTFTQQVRQAASPAAVQSAAPPPMLARPEAPSAPAVVSPAAQPAEQPSLLVVPGTAGTPGKAGAAGAKAEASASATAGQVAAPPPMLAMPVLPSAGESQSNESPANPAGGSGILGSSQTFSKEVLEAATQHRETLVALDERLSNPPSLLAAPSEVAGSITQTNQTDSRTISPVFDIKIEASGNADRDRELLDRLMARLRSELMPMLGAGSSGLDVRLGASLTDTAADRSD